MELSGDLKKQVEQAETKEEKKKLIENAGMKLTDEELDQVSGGLFSNRVLTQDYYDMVKDT